MWEGELLEECRDLLNNVILQPNVLDKWFWWSQHLDVFSVKCPYQSLTRREEDMELELNSMALIRNKVM
jgi:hypothetical protein